MANNGKEGEQLFKEIMEGRGYTVEDVSGNSEYWYKDIDFIITSPTSGETKTFEVKWDTRINRTGNLYLERTSRFTKQPGIEGKGWFEWCEADYLAYGDAVSGQFYIIPMEMLRFKAGTLPYRAAQCGNDSTGQLVSLADIEDITFLL